MTQKIELTDLIATPRPGHFGTTTQSHLFLFDPAVKGQGRELTGLNYDFVTLAPSALPGLRDAFPTPAPDFVTILAHSNSTVTPYEIAARTLGTLGCVDAGTKAMEAACLAQGTLVNAGMRFQTVSQFDVTTPYETNAVMKDQARKLMRELLGPEATL